MAQPTTSPVDSVSPAKGTGEPLWLKGELTKERRDKLLEHAASWVVRKGLEAPCIMFLEMHKPLTALAAVGYAFIQPPLMMLFGFRRTEEVRLLLSERENVELLMDRIESLSLEKREEGKAAKSAKKTEEGDQ